MKTKLTKAKRIEILERRLHEALAGQAHNYHFADRGLDAASTKSLIGSGAIITLTALGGKELIPPTLLRDGLSDNLIAALRSDLRSSYKLATIFRPTQDS
jgi:hypothetical protein